MRGFLGLCGYYSRFVPRYMERTKSLREAKVVGDRLSWTAEADETFKSLKSALTSPPVLALPTFRGTFVLYTDACDYAVGSVLTERLGDNEKVIAYDSKVLAKQQRRWPTYDKELWAIVHAVRRFNQYTVGAEFEVVTDHKPLTGVPNSINVERDGTGRRGRWAIELSSYQFRVIVRPGQSHGNADAMSRQQPAAGNVWREGRGHDSTTKPRAKMDEKRPFAEPLEANGREGSSPPGMGQNTSQGGKLNHQGDSARMAGGASPTKRANGRMLAGYLSSETTACRFGGQVTRLVGESALSRAQQEDDVIAHIRQACLDRKTETPRRALAEWEPLRNSWAQIGIESGLVGVRTKHSFRALVPKTMRTEIMKLAHDHPTSGHLRRSRTTDRVRQHFLWPGMYADIRHYCSSCELCQRRHRPAPKRRAPLVTEVSSRPFHRIAIDITEMPVSANGNRYAVTSHHGLFLEVRQNVSGETAGCRDRNHGASRLGIRHGSARQNPFGPGWPI